MTATSLAPWTTHAPSPLLSAIMGFARAQPTQGLGKKLAQAGARLGLALAPETIDAELYGFRARLSPRDNLSEKRAVFTPQLLDARELDYLSAFIADDFVFFDVGANFGLYALYVAVRAPASARILAFEPQPEMRGRMMTNLALNELENRVVVESCAVSNTDGEATLYVDTRNRGETRLGDGFDLAALTVQARSLLSLMDAHAIPRVDMMKLDVEGHESAILRGLFEAAPRSRLPQRLILETLHKMGGPDDPVALALSHGYEVELDTGRNAGLVLSD